MPLFPTNLKSGTIQKSSQRIAHWLPGTRRRLGSTIPAAVCDIEGTICKEVPKQTEHPTEMPEMGKILLFFPKAKRMRWIQQCEKGYFPKECFCTGETTTRCPWASVVHLEGDSPRGGQLGARERTSLLSHFFTQGQRWARGQLCKGFLLFWTRQWSWTFEELSQLAFLMYVVLQWAWGQLHKGIPLSLSKKWDNTQDTLTSNADILEKNPQSSFLDDRGVKKSVRKIEQSRESLHLQFKVLQK